jgi:hypothetical protein
MNKEARSCFRRRTTFGAVLRTTRLSNCSARILNWNLAERCRCWMSQTAAVNSLWFFFVELTKMLRKLTDTLHVERLGEAFWLVHAASVQFVEFPVIQCRRYPSKTCSLPVANCFCCCYELSGDSRRFHLPSARRWRVHDDLNVAIDLPRTNAILRLMLYPGIAQIALSLISTENPDAFFY